MHRILVTGATGFIGKFLCRRLLVEGWIVYGTLRPSEDPVSLVAGVQPVIIEPLGPETSWNKSLAGIDTVIHLAARVHIMADPSADPLNEFRRVNVEGTLKLARDAVKAGVKRFIYISSIKVNGEETSTAYTQDSLPNPTDPYGISKWESEQGLRQISSETGLEVVIIRPPLAYGPGVKANFLQLMRVVSRGVPLPFASIQNRRSFIFVENLVDALTRCATHPKAAGQTYLVSDGEDVSTAELIHRIAHALDKRALLFPFPINFMRLAGKALGKSSALDRVFGSLVVDTSKIRSELGWRAPFTMDQGLRETAEWFKGQF